jgi:thiamine biosynthesis lipoprotein ApbE
VFSRVAVQEKVLSKDDKILLHKDDITNEVKKKIQTKTKEILKIEQIPDDKLTHAFDNSIKSLTEHWKFGWAGDTKKTSPELLKKYGKDIRRMVKGRVDTSDMFKEPIQLSGKGIDWYEDLSTLSWKEIKKKY